jgi:hypothetical protein
MLLPPAGIPWQITGNHWLSLPCIHPGDASIHAVGVLHRGARSAVEFAASRDFLAGTGEAMLRPTIDVDGVRHELSGGAMAWERAVGWLPTFTCTIDGLVVRGTIFAPYGRDADVAGAVYALSVENRGERAVELTLSLEGLFGHRQLRVQTARAADDEHRVHRMPDDVVILEGAAQPGLASLAIGTDGATTIEIGDERPCRFALRRSVRIDAGGRDQVAFYIAAGPERDGARATVNVLRRRGWRELLATTRDAVRALEQTTGNDAIDRLVNRNLLFCYFYAVGRALDDAHYYLVRTRVPWHGRGVTVRDWEALAWTIPAVQLADGPLARELLLRMCELHGYAPGRGLHYLDGTLFEPGFSLEGAAAYAVAVDRYIRDTGDDQVVEEPVLADTLYLASDDIAERRDQRVPLYSTEVSPSGEPVAHPYTLHANAVVALALEVFRRTLDEESAARVEDPAAVRAAIRRQFTTGEGKGTLATAIDLAGGVSTVDDPLASVYWLPYYETLERQDSVYRRTVRAVDGGRDASAPVPLAYLCAQILGPESGMLEKLRRMPLDGGFAAELVDAEGRAAANGGDAALSGLLAWCAWYAVHTLGSHG